MGEARTELHEGNIIQQQIQQQAVRSLQESTSSSLNPTESSSNNNKPRRLSEVPISEVLNAKHALRWVDPVIQQNATVREAIHTCIEGGLAAMMVISSPDRELGGSANTSSSLAKDRGKVVGMVTSRDLLRILNTAWKDGETDANKIVEKRVGDFMTPINQVIYARPEETIGMCRTIMAKLGVKVLPILSNGRVEGLITQRDMSEFGLDAKDRGGKKHYLESVSERVGLSSDTSMAEPPAYIQAHLAFQQKPLFANVGVFMLPHPFKTPTSCGVKNRREHNYDEVSFDVSNSEDAYFVEEVKVNVDITEGNTITTETREVIYAGVADGVGSWREYDVDPREFSRKFMEECSNIVKEGCSRKASRKLRKGGSADDISRGRLLTPSEIMAQAYDRVKADNIIGSSTACVALFDGRHHQLHFSNLGDSGIIVLRHIDSDIAGVLKRDKTVPRIDRVTDLRVAFVSQQQLRSFNHPYQLGWTGEEIMLGEHSSFKNASESCTTSLHVRRGDIIIMATDGLFDNVEAEDIVKIALEWEQETGFIKGGDIVSREKRWASGGSMTIQSSQAIGRLAKALCDKARENSLNSSVDSPFAILAKENDIMWSGGMPDDCTVVVMHVVGKAAKDISN